MGNVHALDAPDGAGCHRDGPGQGGLHLVQREGGGKAVGHGDFRLGDGGFAGIGDGHVHEPGFGGIAGLGDADDAPARVGKGRFQRFEGFHLV